MPTVINGIGTWYYGQRRIHSRKGACAFCGKLAVLESFDTTLFFVVVYVPLVPLARKRILEQCSVCRRHRVLSLAKWEEAKLQQGTVVIDALERTPHELPRPQVHFGQGSYAFSGLDYEFQDFPATIQVKGNQSVTKTRVALVPQVAAETRLELMMHHVPAPEQDAFCERVLRLDPQQGVFLYWLSSHLPAEQMLGFLGPRLDERPILVEWHRAYQALMDRAQPDKDLRPRYRRLVAETKSDPEALYLLGRVEPDWKQSEALYHQAAQADRPSGYAMYSLGYRALCAAQFGVAANWFQKGPQAHDRPVAHTPCLL
jgi:hypothetical protein